MKKTLLFTAVLGMFALCIDANAECSAYDCIGKIRRIYLPENGDIMIKLDESLDLSPLAKCTPKRDYFVFPANHAQRKESYALMLAAKLTQTPIQVRVEETTGFCTIRYILQD